MLKISNLEKSYGSFQVLKGLDMTVNKGDIYGFLGRNGCGKSTTMNIVSNILHKDNGVIEFGKEDIKIGYLPESPALFTYMNGYEYLEYIGACCKFKGNIKQRVNEVLQLTGMTEGAKRRIKGYSRGMNQRLGIAAAIFDSPDLLILDEPTSALDPQGRVEVMNIISNLAQSGTTIILCTHILSDVERVANRIGIIRDGKMAIEGDINEIRQQFAQQSRKLRISVFEGWEDALRVLSPLTNGKVLFDRKTNIFEITIAPEEDSREMADTVISALREKGLTPSLFELKTKTLEEIYLETIG